MEMYYIRAPSLMLVLFARACNCEPCRCTCERRDVFDRALEIVRAMLSNSSSSLSYCAKLDDPGPSSRQGMRHPVDITPITANIVLQLPLV